MSFVKKVQATNFEIGTSYPELFINTQPRQPDELFSQLIGDSGPITEISGSFVNIGDSGTVTMISFNAVPLS